MKDRRVRFDRLRWWAIKKLVGKTPDLELVGYALSRAGYTDHPHVTDDFITMYATGSDAWRTNTEGERRNNDSLSDDLFQVDTTPCECCGMYPCDEKVCKGFRCCPRCY